MVVFRRFVVFPLSVRTVPKTRHGACAIIERCGYISSFKYCALFVLANLLFLCPTSHSQPNWVKKAIENSKGFNTHDDAEFVTLLRTVDDKFSKNGEIKRKVRWALKILKSNGIEHATLHERVSPRRKIKNLKGWAIKPDGSKKKLKKDNIIEVISDIGAGSYNDVMILYAEFPDLKVGMTVAYEYEVVDKRWTGFHTSHYFQIQNPVVTSSYSVELPDGWKISWYGQMTDDFVSYSSSQNLHTWTASELEYRPTEKFSPAWSNLTREIQVVGFDSAQRKATDFTDWKSVGEWVCSIMREEPSQDNSIMTTATDLVSGAQTLREKVEKISDFVRDEIRYVALEIGIGRWKPRPAETTLNNRFGDCKDKSVLMRAPLKNVGIESSPALALLGSDVISELPSPTQFNHCIVAIPLSQFESDTAGLWSSSSTGWIFFDPTDPSRDLGTIQQNLKGSACLVSVENNSELIKIPEQIPEFDRRLYRAIAKIDEKGHITAQMTVVDYADWAADTRYSRRASTQEKLLENWQARFSDAAPGAKISNLTYGADEDSTWISFQFDVDGYVVETGEMTLLRPDIFHGPRTPLLTEKERKLPIWFGQPYKVEIEINWSYPAGWILKESPKDVEYASSLGDIQGKIKIREGSLDFVSSYLQTGKTLDPSEYKLAQQMDRKKSEMRNMTVVFGK
ncbi:MAG: DUF3857 and transglutaminase domain-containing protein [candidate division Zixibacteria bacterium]|nr:DUF3857 and transglutaminase domain-containing protein [candidate division Zixibacteria bacterium]